MDGKVFEMQKCKIIVLKALDERGRGGGSTKMFISFQLDYIQ